MLTRRSSCVLRLTEKSVASLVPPPEDGGAREAEYGDADCVGLKVSVSRGGRRFFGLRYRLRNRKRYLRFGEWPAITVAEAKKMANEAKGLLARGVDPADERRGALEDVTVAKHFEEYLKDAKTRKRSWADDEGRAKKWVLPAFGRLPLASVTRRDVESLLSRCLAETSAATANRVLALLRHALNTAIRWERLTKNPCEGFPKFPESSGREVYLSADELGRLLQALEADMNPVQALGIWLLAATGCRRAEVCTLQWEAVDLEARIFRLRRTKAGKGRVVVLNDIALATLRRAEAHKAPDGKYVFPAPTKQGHLMVVRGAFKRAKKKAGIRSDFRLHDLRHTFASLAVGAGVSLFEVQKLLGHASSQMTQKYAHLRDETLRRATDTVAAQIGLAAAADDTKVDEVAPAA